MASRAARHLRLANSTLAQGRRSHKHGRGQFMWIARAVGGDGPPYVEGPVSVTGSDPYDLDSDGNGVGCES